MNNRNLAISSRRFYILVGEERNWKISLKEGLWGFTERAKGSWNTTQVNDLLAFYVTSPTMKIIGFGKVTNKFASEDLIWHDEKLFKRSLWKYKISFKIFHVCDNWKDGLQLPSSLFLQVSRKVIDQNTYVDLVNNADKIWGTKILSSYVDNGSDYDEKLT
ncbi:MAG: hypothetical protein KGI07_06155 [Thaumarchaeota archaeon]|nr:hypothetical protein [Nitrososphaerota archaeon]